MTAADLKNSMSAETIDQTICAISGRGHFIGLSTPFTYSALEVYAAGGKLGGKTEQRMIEADFLTASGALSADGQTLLEMHRQRGDRTYQWSVEMAEAARRAPKLVPKVA